MVYNPLILDISGRLGNVWVATIFTFTVFIGSCVLAFIVLFHVIRILVNLLVIKEPILITGGKIQLPASVTNSSRTLSIPINAITEIAVSIDPQKSFSSKKECCELAQAYMATLKTKDDDLSIEITAPPVVGPIVNLLRSEFDKPVLSTKGYVGRDWKFIIYLGVLLAFFSIFVYLELDGSGLTTTQCAIAVRLANGGLPGSAMYIEGDFGRFYSENEGRFLFYCKKAKQFILFDVTKGFEGEFPTTNKEHIDNYLSQIGSKMDTFEVLDVCGVKALLTTYFHPVPGTKQSSYQLALWIPRREFSIIVGQIYPVGFSEERSKKWGVGRYPKEQLNQMIKDFKLLIGKVRLSEFVKSSKPVDGAK